MRRQYSGKAEEIAKSSIDWIQQHSHQYGYAEMRLVLIYTTNEFRLFWGKIELHHKDDAKGESVRFDYDNVLLLSYVLNIDELLSILKSIHQNKFASVGSDMKIAVADNAESFRLESGTCYGYISHTWPIYNSSFNLNLFEIDERTLNFVKRGKPVYPNLWTATSQFLQLDSKLEQHASDRKLLLIMPDFRVRISNIVVSGSKIMIQTDRREISYDKLICKIYVNNNKELYQSADLKFDANGKLVCGVNFEPEIIHAYLIDEKDEILDSVETNLRWSYYNPNVHIETPSLKIIEMIKRGENDEVEFKSRMGEKNDKMSDEFMETFPSFANAKGGVILLGVDDHCQIVGTDEDIDKLEERIAHKMPKIIDPADINFELERVPIDDERSVIVIRVFEGKSKPYIIEGKGILIRRSSNDRPITRSELDIIYDKKHQTSLPAVNY